MPPPESNDIQKRKVSSFYTTMKPTTLSKLPRRKLPFRPIVSTNGAQANNGTHGYHRRRLVLIGSLARQAALQPAEGAEPPAGAQGAAGVRQPDVHQQCS